MSKLIDRLQVRQDDLANTEDGFSLLELVVAVSIMLILAVVGFIAYQSLTDNAREAAVNSAAHEVLTAAVAEVNNPNSGPAGVQELVDDYIESVDGIDVHLASTGTGLTVTAWDAEHQNHYTQLTTAGKYQSYTAGENIPAGMIN